MRQEVNQPGSKPVYEAPTIEVLGGFAQLTLGGKNFGSRFARTDTTAPRAPDRAPRTTVAHPARAHRSRSGRRFSSRRENALIHGLPIAAMSRSRCLPWRSRARWKAAPRLSRSQGVEILAAAGSGCARLQACGLEPPLPISLCIAGSAPETDEREWQERVLDHLQIPHWHRIPIGGELDPDRALRAPAPASGWSAVPGQRSLRSCRCSRRRASVA